MGLQTQQRTRYQRRRDRRGQDCRGQGERAKHRRRQGRGIGAEAEQGALREVERAELTEDELIAQAHQGIDTDQDDHALAERRQREQRHQRRQQQDDEPEGRQTHVRPACRRVRRTGPAV
jgi:hypothetical protein